MNRDLSTLTIDHINCGIIAIDTHYKINTWNCWMADYSGISVDDAIGKSLSEIFPGAINQRLNDSIIAAVEQSMPAIISNVFNRSPLPLYKPGSSSDSPVSQVINIIPEKVGGKNYCVIQIEDITASVLREKALQKQVQERKEVEKQLTDAFDRLQEALNVKSDFLAAMSHEIRTPLNAIIGVAQLMRSADNEEEKQEYIETILDSGRSLLSIINDILDFSKIEAGKLSLDNQAIDFSQTIREAVDQLAHAANEKNLPVNIHYPEHFEKLLIGDSVRIKQVLTNLVSNAIKFTSEGQIDIFLEVLESDKKQSEFKITIQDTGIGIKAEQQKNLFEKFTQADISTTRKFGGTGLGLAICKQLLELMDGTIGFKSEEGTGSTFWFTLKMEHARRSHPSAKEVNGSADKSEINRFKGTVLLVEDVKVNQLVAKKILEKLGLNVILAENGVEAVEICQSMQFDIIFMDCQMPEMDGFEATREIRKLEQNQLTPIIALTALAMTGDRQFCIDAGMDDYITKPYEIGEIQRILQRWLTGIISN